LSAVGKDVGGRNKSGQGACGLEIYAALTETRRRTKLASAATQTRARQRSREGSMQKTVSLTVNGKPASATVEGRTLLVQLLRAHLGLTGTHVGCDTSQCGACVVHINGDAIKSCTILDVQ